MTHAGPALTPLEQDIAEALVALLRYERPLSWERRRLAGPIISSTHY